MNRVVIDIVDIEEDKDILLNTIVEHINSVEPKISHWRFAQVGWDKLSEIENFDEPDLLRIEIDMCLLGNTYQKLISELGFIENKEFKTENAYDGVGALLIYWD